MWPPLRNMKSDNIFKKQRQQKGKKFPQISREKRKGSIIFLLAHLFTVLYLSPHSINSMQTQANIFDFCLFWPKIPKAEFSLSLLGLVGFPTKTIYLYKTLGRSTKRKVKVQTNLKMDFFRPTNSIATIGSMYTNRVFSKILGKVVTFPNKTYIYMKHIVEHPGPPGVGKICPMLLRHPAKTGRIFVWVRSL